jgi:hypothetical protein
MLSIETIETTMFFWESPNLRNSHLSVFKHHPIVEMHGQQPLPRGRDHDNI